MRVVEPLVPVWVAAGDIGAAPPLPISSVACGLAWNLPALVIFRIIQGLGGGAIIPTAQATLFAAGDISFPVFLDNYVLRAGLVVPLCPLTISPGRGTPKDAWREALCGTERAPRASST